MAIEMARKAGAFFSVVDIMSCITLAKRHCYGQLKNKSELHYCFLLCINVVCILWRPTDSNACRFGYHCRRRASDRCILQRGRSNKLISHLLYNFIMNPSMAASSNPFRRGSRGWGVFIHGNHAARWENGSSWWGCLCDVCFANKKSSEQEFFVLVRTHLHSNT
jgi:hypothetical protein